MKTKIIRIDTAVFKKDDIKEAVTVLKNGGLVVIPTETVYGIAADSSNPKTLQRLYQIKKRPKDKLFSLHATSIAEAENNCAGILPCAYRLMENFWPGPLTLVLKSKNNGTIGIRIPDNKVAMAIIREAALPIVCPSANLSGKEPPKTAGDALKDLEGLVDLIIDSGRTSIGEESSVVDASVFPVKILRAGAIPEEKIRQVADKKNVLFVCTGNSCRSVMAKALMEKKLKENKRSDVNVLSAGVMLLGGMGASEATRELLKKEGIDVSGHRSQGVTAEMIKKSELILVMERIHEERILELVPEAKNRLFLLKEFAKIDDESLDIADPMGKSTDFYLKTLEIIKESIERIANIA